MILDNKEDFMEGNEMNLKKAENSKGGTLKYIIIALLVLVAIIVVVLLIIFNQKSTPKEIFNASITNLREQLNSFNTQNNEDVVSEKMIVENHMRFNTDIEELSMLNNNKLDATFEIDQTNNYFNLITSLSNSDKRIIDMMIYMIDDIMYFESTDLFDTPIEIGNITEDSEITATVSNEDYFYLFDKTLEYFNNSLMESKFSQNNDTITIGDEEVNVIANNYLIDDEAYQTMSDTFKEKILNDDRYLEVLSNLLEMSKEELIEELNEEQSSGSVAETAGKSEASLIYSSINNYCATSAMKALLAEDYIDICADGVTAEEVEYMVNLGNAEIVEIVYTDKVENLIVNSNGYTFTLQEDGSFLSTKNEEQLNATITIYTNNKDEFIGFRLTEDENILINYTDYNDTENFEVYLDESNTIKGECINDIVDVTFLENNEEVLNINFKIAENSLEFNIDTPNAKDYFGISFKQTNEVINENETKSNMNIILYFGNETNPYSIEFINEATIYYNADITVKNPDNSIASEQLTEDDIMTILTNLQERLENTDFEAFLELFMINNNPTY